MTGEETVKLILYLFRPSSVYFSEVLIDVALLVLVLVGVAADWLGPACKHGNTTKD